MASEAAGCGEIVVSKLLAFSRRYPALCLNPEETIDRTVMLNAQDLEIHEPEVPFYFKQMQ